MSRIAGVYFRRGVEPRPPFVPRMLAASGAGAAWESRVEVRPGAALGGASWRTPAAGAALGLAIAIDGTIYNTADFDPAATIVDLVAELYARQGFERTVCRLNGDFAIALYDEAADTLWLARDRFGIRPLYYVDSGERCAFASRPAALLSLPDVDRGINRGFVARFAGAHYRYFDNRPDESPYAAISQLPAGHLLQVSRGGTRKAAFWSLSDSPDLTGSFADLGQQYRELLMDAVAVRVASTAKPAFTLSGGMDSSSVVVSAMKATGGATHAFSTVYDDKTYDESADIQPMIEATGLEWHPIAVEPGDVFGLIERMVRAHDEPVATATWLSHYLLCEEVRRRGFSGLFGGLGGDELNAGEYEYFLYFFADLRAAGMSGDDWDQEIAGWAAHHDHPVFRKNAGVVEEGLSRLVDFSTPGRCRPDQTRLRKYYGTVQREFFDLESFAPRMDHPFSSYLKNRTSQDLLLETLPCCLRAEDRHSAASNLEHALPFLDHRLVEFMFRVPGTMKIRRGVTKQLLREAMKGLLPEETRTRVKKTGWNAPAHVWFSGAGLQQVRDLVASRPFRERGIYNVARVEQLVGEHADIVASGRAAENHMMFLWQMVNLEIWLRAVDEAGAHANRRDG